MTEAEVKLQLRAEGYHNVSAWLDSPDFSYPEHTHDLATVHVVLAGEMHILMNGADRTVGPGDRCDIPAGMPHVATMGRAGCTYVSGEK